MKKKRNSISILIPCHNEEKSIRKCVESCLNQTRPADEIVVVDDDSTDSSLKILKSFGKKIKVVSVKKRLGNKSFAQEHGLKFVTGEIFIATDGDTVLSDNFVERVAKSFQDKKVVAFSGYVKSLRHNWLTALREIDYTIGQKLHKLAQSYLNSLFVIPGCAGAFRTDIFKKYISFDHDTLTEDLDFTYKLHENKFKIVYDRQAIVYTQDPADLRSYIKQMRRWYSGGWQNLVKHFRPALKRPKNFFELSLIYVEGFAFSVLLFIGPIISLKVYLTLMTPYFLIIIGLGVYASLVSKRIDLVFYSPLYMILIFINAGVFMGEFVKEVILKKKNTTWVFAERRVI
ncbi:glycosyltransferase [Patescibacteria group bacterium]